MTLLNSSKVSAMSSLKELNSNAVQQTEIATDQQCQCDTHSNPNLSWSQTKRKQNHPQGVSSGINKFQVEILVFDSASDLLPIYFELLVNVFRLEMDDESEKNETLWNVDYELVLRLLVPSSKSCKHLVTHRIRSNFSHNSEVRFLAYRWLATFIPF